MTGHLAAYRTLKLHYKCGRFFLKSLTISECERGLLAPRLLWERGCNTLKGNLSTWGNIQNNSAHAHNLHWLWRPFRRQTENSRTSNATKETVITNLNTICIWTNHPSADFILCWLLFLYYSSIQSQSNIAQCQLWPLFFPPMAHAKILELLPGNEYCHAFWTKH